jgi:hypothetical protein
MRQGESDEKRKGGVQLAVFLLERGIAHVLELADERNP